MRQRPAGTARRQAAAHHGGHGGEGRGNGVPERVLRTQPGAERDQRSLATVFDAGVAGRRAATCYDRRCGCAPPSPSSAASSPRARRRGRRSARTGAGCWASCGDDKTAAPWDLAAASSARIPESRPRGRVRGGRSARTVRWASSAATTRRRPRLWTRRRWAKSAASAAMARGPGAGVQPGRAAAGRAAVTTTWCGCGDSAVAEQRRIPTGHAAWSGAGVQPGRVRRVLARTRDGWWNLVRSRERSGCCERCRLTGRGCALQADRRGSWVNGSRERWTVVAHVCSGWLARALAAGGRRVVLPGKTLVTTSASGRAVVRRRGFSARPSSPSNDEPNRSTRRMTFCVAAASRRSRARRASSRWRTSAMVVATRPWPRGADLLPGDVTGETFVVARRFVDHFGTRRVCRAVQLSTASFFVPPDWSGPLRSGGDSHMQRRGDVVRRADLRTRRGCVVQQLHRPAGTESELVGGARRHDGTRQATRTGRAGQVVVTPRSGPMGR